MGSQPTGTVTFLFTDVVGSTARWEADPQLMAEALALHDEVMRRRSRLTTATCSQPAATGSRSPSSEPTTRSAAAVAAQRSLRTARGPAAGHWRCVWERTPATRSSGTATTSARPSTGPPG